MSKDHWEIINGTFSQMQQAELRYRNFTENEIYEAAKLCNEGKISSKDFMRGFDEPLQYTGALKNVRDQFPKIKTAQMKQFIIKLHENFPIEPLLDGTGSFQVNLSGGNYTIMPYNELRFAEPPAPVTPTMLYATLNDIDKLYAIIHTAEDLAKVLFFLRGVYANELMGKLINKFLSEEFIAEISTEDRKRRTLHTLNIEFGADWKKQVMEVIND